jgi:ParB family chromosome partitioning protein
MRGEISMGHARAVATSDDPEALAREVIAKGLSVRQAEDYVRREKSRSGPTAGSGRSTTRTSSGSTDADLTALERQLADILGLKVQITHKGEGGAVSLHYSNLDQLDMLCQRLSGEPI